MFLHQDLYKRKYQLDLVKELANQKKGYKILILDSKDSNEVASLGDYYITFVMNQQDENLISLSYILTAQILALLKAINLGKTPDNPWPSGEVNRVVTGVKIYPFEKEDK